MNNETIEGVTYEYVLYANQRKNWQGVVDLCSALDGNFTLPVPLNEAENEFWFSANGGNKKVPLGITDKDSEGTWVNYYTGGQIGYTNWNGGQPDNGWFGGEHFGYTGYMENTWTYTSKWGDFNGDEDQDFHVVCTKCITNCPTSNGAFDNFSSAIGTILLAFIVNL